MGIRCFLHRPAMQSGDPAMSLGISAPWPVAKETLWWPYISVSLWLWNSAACCEGDPLVAIYVSHFGCGKMLHVAKETHWWPYTSVSFWLWNSAACCQGDPLVAIYKCLIMVVGQCCLLPRRPTGDHLQVSHCGCGTVQPVAKETHWWPYASVSLWLWDSAACCQGDPLVDTYKCLIVVVGQCSLLPRRPTGGHICLIVVVEQCCLLPRRPTGGCI